MHLPPRSRRAFTLIELLVVIAIIALLVGILLPALSNAKSVAQFVRCQTNMRSIGQGLQSFAVDHNDRKVPAAKKNPPPSTIWFRATSTPNTRSGGQPVGLGRLVDEGYLVFGALQDPGRNLSEDRLIDEEKWQTAVSSGSSYLYFYRYDTDPFDVFIPGDPTAWYTFDRAREMDRYAVVSDMNTEEDHGFTGAFETGVPWVSHPQERRSNILFLDGSVDSSDNDEMILRNPPAKNMHHLSRQAWFEEAHTIYAGG